MRRCCSTTLALLGALWVAACGPRLLAPAFHPDRIGLDQGAARHAAAAGWQTLLVGDRATAERLLARHDTPESLAGRALLARAAGLDAAEGEAWLDLLLQAPEHPLAAVTSVGLRRLVDRWNGLDLDLQRRLPSVLEQRPGLDAHTRDRLRRVLIRVLRRHGAVDEADRQTAALGLLCQWDTVGPFGRFPPLEDPTAFWPVQHDRIDEPAPPEITEEPALAPRALPGSGEPGDVFGESTRAFAPASCVAGRVRLGGEPTRGGVSYGRSIIGLAQPTEVLMTLVTSASAMLWVDGEAVLRSDRFAAFGSERRSVALRLSAGEHRILVALTSDFSRPAFSLAISDVHGRPVGFSERRLAGAAQPLTGIAQLIAKQPTARDHFRAEAEAVPDNPLPQLWLAMLASAEGDTVRAEEHITRALELAPDAAALGLIEALILLDDPALPRKERRDRARASLKRTLEQDPGCTAALYWMARLEQLERRLPEARRLLEQAIDEQPGSYRWPVRLHRIFADQGWVAEAEAALATARKLAPGSPSVLQAGLRWAQRRHALQAIEDLTTRMAQSDPDSHRIARRRARAGQLDAAAAEYERLARRRPQDRGLLRARASLKASRGAYAEAAELLAGADGLVTAQEQKQLASYRLLAGHREAALEDLATALARDPDNTRLPLAVALLTGRTPLQEFAVDPLTEIAASQEQADDAGATVDSGASAELLLDQYVLDLTAPGPPIERVHTLTRVLTKEGVRRWGEVRVPSEAVLLSLKVIKSDGHVLEPESLDDKDTVSLPGLAIGDHVDFEYVAPTSYSAVFPGGFLGDPFYFRVHDLPVRHSLVLVRAREGALPEFELNNGVPAPEVVEEGQGIRVHRWEARELAPMLAEPRSVPPKEYLPFLRIGLRVEVEDTQRALAAMLPERLRTERTIRARAEAVRETWGAPRDRVREIYAAVRAEVPASEGSGGLRDAASHVLARGRGSRTTLLVALLGAAGVRADVVAVQPFASASHERSLPDLGEYPYYVVRARPDDRRAVWLDANFRFGEYDYLPPALQDRPALVLAAGEEQPIRTPTFPESRERKDIALELDLDAGGAVHGRGVEKVRGWMAVNLREALVQMQPYQHRQMFELALGRYFPGLTLADYAIEDLESTSGEATPLTLKYSFEVPALGRRVDDRLMLEHGLYPVRLGASFLQRAERQLPLLVDAMNYARIVVQLRLPEGARIVTGPEPVTLTGAFGRYSRKVSEVQHGVVVEKVIAVPPQRISPEAYVEFAEFCHAVDRHEAIETVIAITEAPAPQ